MGADEDESERCAARLRLSFDDEELGLVAIGAELLRDQHPDIWLGDGSVEESVHWIAKVLCRVRLAPEEVPHE